MQKNFPAVQMVAIADLDQSKAKEAADKHGIPNVLSTDDLLGHEDVEIVLNLTIPAAHVEVAEKAIEHGKHTYLEKPLGIDRADGQRLVDKASAAGLRVGCAPDTFMGAGLQTARKIIDEGTLGGDHRLHRLHDRPRARALAPVAGVLLPARRRADGSTWGHTT